MFLREPLEAERYFRFRFAFIREPTPAQLEEFRTRARPVFDTHLASLSGQGVPLAAAGQLRTDLAEIVRSIAGPAQWEPAAGSLFDTADGLRGRSTRSSCKP